MPNSLIEPVRKTVVARDASAALHWITTMEEALDAQTVNERFWTVLATAYAGTAFLLAVIGLYGVLSHSVASRRQEMGVQAGGRRDGRSAGAARYRAGFALWFCLASSLVWASRFSSAGCSKLGFTALPRAILSRCSPVFFFCSSSRCSPAGSRPGAPHAPTP